MLDNHKVSGILSGNTVSYSAASDKYGGNFEGSWIFQGDTVTGNEKYTSSGGVCVTNISFTGIRVGSSVLTSTTAKVLEVILVKHSQ